MKTPWIGSVTGVIGRIPILDVEPSVDCGRRPAKAVNGETFEVSATIFREGHGALGAGVVLRDPSGRPGPLVSARRLVGPPVRAARSERVDQRHGHGQHGVRVTVEVHLTSYISRVRLSLSKQ